MRSYDNHTFEMFFKEHYTSFCYFGNRYINDPLLSEDIVSEVALKVWEKRAEIKNEAALKAYFYTSLRNACIDFIAKEKTGKKRKRQYAQSITLEEIPFTEQLIRTETLRQLETAINSLPTQCRTVFIKLFQEGKSLSEAADEMGLSIFSIKAQRQRGIKLLRERMAITTMFIFLLTHFICL